jgi:hypothetical protein
MDKLGEPIHGPAEPIHAPRRLQLVRSTRRRSCSPDLGSSHRIRALVAGSAREWKESVGEDAAPPWGPDRPAASAVPWPPAAVPWLAGFAPPPGSAPPRPARSTPPPVPDVEARRWIRSATPAPPPRPWPHQRRALLGTGIRALRRLPRPPPRASAPGGRGREREWRRRRGGAPPARVGEGGKGEGRRAAGLGGKKKGGGG